MDTCKRHTTTISSTSGGSATSKRQRNQWARDSVTDNANRRIILRISHKHRAISHELSNRWSIHYPKQEEDHLGQLIVEIRIPKLPVSAP